MIVSWKIFSFYENFKQKGQIKNLENKMKNKRKIKYFHQTTDYTCGPASIKMALSFFEIFKSEKQLAGILRTDSKKGTRINDFISGAKFLGFDYVIKTSSKVKDLRMLQKKGYVVVVCYFIPEENLDHYSVLKKVGLKNIYFFDPWFGEDHKYSINYFKRIWKCDERFDKEKAWCIALKK